MAILERKQLTGTDAQVKGYAGHNGQLAYATDTKHLHVLSGTAGQTTELANKADIPTPVDISGKADKTYVDTGLAKKANASHTHTISNVTGLQDALDAKATTEALTTGLAGKLNVAGKAQTAGTADTANSLASTAAVPYSQITGAPSIPNISNLVPKSGDIGTFTAYETQAINPNGTIGISSPSALVFNKGAGSASTNNYVIAIDGGIDGKFCTKVVYIWNAGSVKFNAARPAASVTWVNGTAPTFKRHSIVLIMWHNANVITLALVSSNN